MDPVIGLDIAKGKSQVQAFLQKKNPYKKSFVFEHNVLGLQYFYQFYREVEEAADRDPFKRNLYTSHIVTLTMYIEILLQHQRHLSKLLEEIDALADEFEDYKIIRSIPGIGGKIAATIISEIGEVDQFTHPKKLVAYAGVDPSVHESGKFRATINRITKRG